MDNSVKRFARAAKARLLGNSYEQTSVKQPSGRVFKLENDGFDEKMYQKVCEMMKLEFVSNPIGQLIDRSYYDGLSEVNKMKYVIRLSAKYIELLEKYRKEFLLPKTEHALTLV